MSPEQWQRLQELFEAAVELTTNQRTALLDRECGNDPMLRQQVESLIISSNQGDTYLHNAVRGAAQMIAETESLAEVAEHIGPYRLVRELGHGGMGSVHLAVRADDEYQKQVAIKLVNGGVPSRELLRRFRSERQILANLDHPNIARLLDGGTTEVGSPYVVMDYVEGEPIDEYADRSKLATEERLRLFRKVCATVQYAHQNLVVHRDIKPGNILVTADGEPKLLDFGIAKLLRPDAFFHTVAETRADLRLMTPEYASPEQVRGEPIGTASDVYSLGVLLYELLSGRPPYKLKSRTPKEVEEAICGWEPEKPSTAVTREGESGTAGGPITVTGETIGHRRGTTTDKLKRRLRGDLDNIVLMAMRKEPARRYGSVEQFSEDIRRHLEGLPVLAGRDTLGYRSHKFVRRHRAAVAATAVVLIMIAALVGFYTGRLATERDRAQLEAIKAAKVSEFLTGLFEVSDPSQSRGQSITAKELLDRGAARIKNELTAQPEVRASIMNVIGNVYESLGLYNDAHPLLAESLEMRSLIHGEQSVEVAESMSDLARVLHFKGDYTSAEPLFRKALDLRQNRTGLNDLDVAETMTNLAETLYERNELDASESLVRQALDIRTALLPEGHPKLTSSLNDLASVLRKKRDFDSAESLFRRALDMDRKLHGEVHPSIANNLNSLGLLLREKGDPKGAEPLLREALALNQRLYGDENPRVVFNLHNLGLVVADNGDFEEAEGLFRTSLDIRRKLFGEEHPHVLFSTQVLGNFLHDKGDFENAEHFLRQSLAIPRKLFGENHPDYVRALVSLGVLLVDKGDHKVAAPVLRQAVELGKKVLGADNAYMTMALSTQARLASVKGDHQTAERMLREILEVQRKALPSGHLAIADSQTALGTCLTAQNRFEEAEPLLLESYSTVSARRGAENWRTKRTISRLVTLYEAWRKRDKAKQYREMLTGGIRVARW